MSDARDTGGLREAIGEQRASLTRSPKFGAAIWLGKRLVARIEATIDDSRTSPEEPEPRWLRDAMVFVDAVNAIAGQRPPLDIARLSRLWDINEDDLRAALSPGAAHEERGLDVERLARALDQTMPMTPEYHSLGSWTGAARMIAAEYTAPTPTTEEPE